MDRLDSLNEEIVYEINAELDKLCEEYADLIIEEKDDLQRHQVKKYLQKMAEEIKNMICY